MSTTQTTDDAITDAGAVSGEGFDAGAVLLALGERLTWQYGLHGFEIGRVMYSYRIDKENGIFYARYWNPLTPGSPTFEDQTARATVNAAKHACEIHAATGRWEM
jgi:hypothetical protein